MRLCLEAISKLSFWSEFLGQMRTPNQAPETLLKLLVQMPSLLRAHLSIDIMLWSPWQFAILSRNQNLVKQ
jgi:hypothetical protein